MTTVYEAILKAADHIEQNPQDFDFLRNDVPSDCGTPGCALGWIGFFHDYRSEVNYIAEYVSESVLGLPAFFRINNYIYCGSMKFYERMTELDGCVQWGESSWVDDPQRCARALRLYAEKYHAPVPALPEAVRQIFVQSAPAVVADVVAD